MVKSYVWWRTRTIDWVLVNLVETLCLGLPTSYALQQILSSKLSTIERAHQSQTLNEAEASSSSEFLGCGKFDFYVLLNEIVV